MSCYSKLERVQPLACGVVRQRLHGVRPRVSTRLPPLASVTAARVLRRFVVSSSKRHGKRRIWCAAGVKVGPWVAASTAVAAMAARASSRFRSADSATLHLD